MFVAALVVALLGAASPSATASGPSDDENQLRLRASGTDDVTTPAPVIGDLADGDVLEVYVVDGVPGARGVVRQCVRTLDGYRQCVNSFPVQFGDLGDATFQYRLVDPGDCGPAGSCVLVITDRGGERQADAVLVFGAAAPDPPKVTLTPAGLVEEGDEAGVEVAGLAPGARVQVGYCAPECSTFEAATADEFGRATARVVIGDRCGQCGIAVIGGAYDSITRVRFAPHLRRLTNLCESLSASSPLAFALAARRIIVSVDWTPPSEASTPELDAVEL